MTKLSVIIPMYNCQKYIEKSILSVINQNLKDIQIIIVNDGSTDDSSYICRKLEQKYGCIELYHQENKGPGAARNTGLKHAKGKYVTFLDGDDYIPNNTFKNIYRLLEKNGADIFVGNILCFDDVRTWHLPYMKKVFNGNKKSIVGKFEALKELVNTPSVCNKWFRAAVIKKNKLLFEESIKVGEDFLFTQSVLINCRKIVLRDIDMYAYRLINGESLINQSNLNFFKELGYVQRRILEIYNGSNISSVEAELRQVVFLIDSIFLKSKGIDADQINDIVSESMDIFQLNDCIEINRTDFRNLERYFLAYLLKSGKRIQAIKFIQRIILSKAKAEIIYDDGRYYSYINKYFPEERDRLEIKPKIESKVENAYFDEHKLIIRGYSFVRGIDIEDIANIKRVLVLKGKKYNNVVRQKIRNDYRTDLTYIFKNDRVNYNWGGYKPIILELNELINDTYDIYIEISIVDQIFVAPFDFKLAEIKNKIKGRKINNEVYFESIFEKSKYLKINIRKVGFIDIFRLKAKKIKSNVRYDLSLLKNKKYKSFIVLIMYKILGWYYKRLNIWLMGERPDTAQDNTYHLFKYIKENDDHINVKYIITSDSKDLSQISEYRDIVTHGSILHSVYLLTCKFTINSYVERPNMYTKEYLDIIKYYPEFVRNKKVFLQHGVIGVSRVNHVLHKNRVNYDLFIVSSEFEKRHMIEEYGYKDNEVIISGLARWDNLKRCINKNILIMPTWRSWIKSEEELINSGYLNRYIELLNSDKFQEIILDLDIKVVFYPHYQVQRLIGEIPISLPQNIRIVYQGEKRVQELINESGLLITDYSTVAYDFNYCNKPVIFYEFDKHKFYSEHYNLGPLASEKNTFGVHVESLNELIKEIKIFEAENDDFDFKPKFKGKICEKIFSSIKEL